MPVQSLLIASLLFVIPLACVGGVEPTSNVVERTDDVEIRGAEVHLQLVLQVTNDGNVELISASELAGPALVSDAPKGDHLLEVSRGDQILSVEAIYGLFEARSFGGPPEDDASHHVESQASAVVKIKLPGIALESSDLADTVFRLHRILPGTPVSVINSETMSALKGQDRLETIIELPLGVFEDEIRERGERVPDS